MKIREPNFYWSVAYWTLLIAWILGALLNMSGVNGGFFTNYLSDIAFPPWFYIYIRGLNTNDQHRPKLLLVRDWFGRTPIIAFISIFTVGVLTELKTLYWPTGPITGTYDSFDILAYFIGMLICWFFDTKTKNMV